MPWIVALLTAFLSISKCDGFLHSMNIRATRSVDYYSVNICVTRTTRGDDSCDQSHRWKHEPFDFSSKSGWDDFYEKGLKHTDSVESTSEVSREGEIGDKMEALEYEWHGHIPHSAVVDAIEPTISLASQYYSQLQSTSTAKNDLPSILMVGCGNSALPRILHDAFDTPVRVTCLDYSPVCIELVKSLYESSCPNMDFVVGDATKLQDVLWDEDAVKQSSGKKHFDVIIDKGLVDALMCGEGFDLENLMGGVSDVLTPREWGTHVLICFQLSKASKQSLAEVENSVGEPILVWDFDIPVEGSDNGRACFNLARRRRGQSTTGLGIENSITTEWI